MMSGYSLKKSLSPTVSAWIRPPYGFTSLCCLGVEGNLVFCILDRLSVFAFEFLVDDVHRTGDSDLRIRKLA